MKQIDLGAVACYFAGGYLKQGMKRADAMKLAWHKARKGCVEELLNQGRSVEVVYKKKKDNETKRYLLMRKTADIERAGAPKSDSQPDPNYVKAVRFDETDEKPFRWTSLIVDNIKKVYAPDGMAMWGWKLID